MSQDQGYLGNAMNFVLVLTIISFVIEKTITPTTQDKKDVKDVLFWIWVSGIFLLVVLPIVGLLALKGALAATSFGGRRRK